MQPKSLTPTGKQQCYDVTSIFLTEMNSLVRKLGNRSLEEKPAKYPREDGDGRIGGEKDGGGENQPPTIAVNRCT